MTPCKEYAAKHGRRKALALWQHSGEGMRAQRIHDNAKALCAACPIKDQCLAKALVDEGGTSYRFGVFGGLDANERALFATGHLTAAGRDAARAKQRQRRADLRAELAQIREARSA